VINYKRKAEGLPVKILVTNDDGIHSEGLWTLVRELKKIATITVVTPDSERSAIGTAVSLFQPLQVEEVNPAVNGVTAYTVDGTSSDCVILGHGKLATDIDMVVAGINPGPNYGEDVFISGTVGAAMQGFTRGLPALSASSASFSGDRDSLEAGAKAAAALVQRLAAENFPRVFLNLNVPELPLDEVKDIKLTRLARSSHINTVTEDNDGAVKQYRMIRERLVGAEAEGTDIQAVIQGKMSLTPLYTSFYDKPPQRLLKKLCAGLLQQLQN
jgi:5'-nucleotidase